MQDIGGFLDHLARHCGAGTDKELADCIGVRQAKLSDWRHGRYGVTLASLLKIETKCGIPVTTQLSWLAGVKDAPKGRKPRRPLAGGPANAATPPAERHGNDALRHAAYQTAYRMPLRKMLGQRAASSRRAA